MVRESSKCFKNWSFPASFVYFSGHFYGIKIVDIRGIRTRIVGVEGEHADHQVHDAKRCDKVVCVRLCDIEIHLKQKRKKVFLNLNETKNVKKVLKCMQQVQLEGTLLGRTLSRQKS